MKYNHKDIESKWRARWEKDKPFKAIDGSDKPKFYSLDMFPYPSGAGLHVGHPLGYIASDIISRYKRLEGFNVLHPLGYDAFGLPAEQYAIQTGQHPAQTTEENVQKYTEQLKLLGLSFDWDRTFRTTDADYYKWTQWIFLQLFDAWFDTKEQKAKPIAELIARFEKEGTHGLTAAQTEELHFTASDWNNYTKAQQAQTLLNYRLTYRAESVVNWCPAMGTVLANDEVKEGVSERGGYPVEQKKMTQWMMRITAYADRLLSGLETLDWSDSMKETQRNWIGKSRGSSIEFAIKGDDKKIEVFSTRPDTLYGASFIVLSPEHELVQDITTTEQAKDIADYCEQAAQKSDRQRQEDAGETISGCFTGAYAIHPLSEELTPIWIADYVLSGYGTGAVMAVPAHDSRDHRFATKYQLPIVPVIESDIDVQQEPYEDKSGVVINSELINGLEVAAAIPKMIGILETRNIGTPKVQYKLRDAVFSRQRYWGEPVPMYFDADGVPTPVDEKDLPITLPEVDEYLPTEQGEPPLARAKDWTYKGFPLETNTMPAWAGSSWYMLRYLDPKNAEQFISKASADYWQNVDLYIGGSEHATGHLLYSRFWFKVLKDLGYIQPDEPFQKMINQGMILGTSAYVYRDKDSGKFISADMVDQYNCVSIPIDIKFVNDTVVDVEALKSWRPDFRDAEFIFTNDFTCHREVEKMSKSKYNVVNPDDVVEEYGADTMRMYEMFLGPLTQHKPWKTEGLSGVYGFVKKFWKLFYNKEGEFLLTNEPATKAELKILHTLIKKVQYDISHLSLNTTVSAFMIATNELSKLQSNNREVLETMVVLLSPFAPFVSEELWEKLGHSTSVTFATLPELDEAYLVEDSFEYPICINGKMKIKLEFSLSETADAIKTEVLAHDKIQGQINGKQLIKFIHVPKKIVNLVVK